MKNFKLMFQHAAHQRHPNVFYILFKQNSARASLPKIGVYKPAASFCSLQKPRAALYGVFAAYERGMQLCGKLS